MTVKEREKYMHLHELRSYRDTTSNRQRQRHHVNYTDTKYWTHSFNSLLTHFAQLLCRGRNYLEPITTIIREGSAVPPDRLLTKSTQGDSGSKNPDTGKSRVPQATIRARVDSNGLHTSLLGTSAIPEFASTAPSVARSGKLRRPKIGGGSATSRLHLET